MLQPDSLSDSIAVSLFDAAGFSVSRESLNTAYVAMAAEIPWSAIKVQYHFEEAIIAKCFMIEAEYLASTVTSIIKGVEAQTGWQGRTRGMSAADVFLAAIAVAFTVSLLA